jgi:hypothetical protein
VRENAHDTDRAPRDQRAIVALELSSSLTSFAVRDHRYSTRDFVTDGGHGVRYAADGDGRQRSSGGEVLVHQPELELDTVPALRADGHRGLRAVPRRSNRTPSTVLLQGVSPDCVQFHAAANI